MESQSYPKRQFGSDNFAGICPEAWHAMQAANDGHEPGYGDDRWTARASDLLRDLFELDCEVFFSYNGTAANAMALASICQSHHAIICHQLAHVETDECGAPEFFSGGSKILAAQGDDGRISADSLTELVGKRSDLHFPKPRALSLTQATELGTVYSLDQLQTLCGIARQHQLRIHMDGARFANAVAALDVAPKEVTWKVGVDVLCFGGTKNGMAVGEAMLFFNRDLANEFEYRCKQSGQLASKMRFLTAPWVGMLESGAWLRNAKHANQSAANLERRLRHIEGLEFSPRQANAVFVSMPENVSQELRARGWQFYHLDGTDGARLMCSWDTSDSDIDSFVRDLREAMDALV